MIGAKTVLDGREVQFFNVHLLAFFMLGSSSTMFPWQRDLVADRLASSDLPTILRGDFNVSQHASLVEQFAEFGYATVQYKIPTWHRRPFVLDHIFYNSGLRCIRPHRGGLRGVRPHARGRGLRFRLLRPAQGFSLARRLSFSASRSSSRRALSDAICFLILSASSPSRRSGPVPGAASGKSPSRRSCP